jgi:integrase
MKPVKVDDGRGKPWMVAVPASMSDTGRYCRRFFETEKQAKAFAKGTKVLQRVHGDLLSNLSREQLIQAVAAVRILDSLGVTILDAAERYVEEHNRRNASKSLAEAFDAFMEAKSAKSVKYRQELRQAKTTFGSIASKMVSDIDLTDIEGCLKGLPPGAYNAKLRRVRSVLAFAITRDWCSDNVATKVDFADGQRLEVEVFPVDTVQALLDHALEHDLELLPYRVLTFFCGIRPGGELSRLSWDDIRIPERLVVLPAAITKTKRKRFVDLSENAVAWLEEYRSRGGVMTGMVAPWSSQIRRTKHRRACCELGIKWIQQGARHSFCSYWLATHRDADKLVLMSGHDDAATMWRRYHAGVSEDDAKRFWSIRPK